MDSNQLREELKFLKNLDVKKIILNVESPGGYVSHALAMHDLLTEHPAEIEARIYGITASSATIVLGASDTIAMSDNALFLIHRVRSISWGTPEDLVSEAREAEKVEDRIINIYKKWTGKRDKTIKNWMYANKGAGEWWNADEAVSNGFVDESFEPKKRAALVLSEEVLNKANLPTIPSNKINSTMPKTNNSGKKKGFWDELWNLIKGEDGNEPLSQEEFQNAMTTAVDNLESQYNEQITNLTTERDEANDRVSELENQVSELEGEVEYLETEVENLKGGKTGSRRSNRKDPPPGKGGAKKNPKDQFKNDLVSELKNQINVRSAE